MNRSGAAAAHVLAGVSACAVVLQAVLCQAAGDPMAFWETVSWSASNNITQAVSFEGRPGRELLEVVKIGNVNGDSYQDILVRVSQTNYALILGGNRPKKMFTSAMDIDSPGIVQCWFATSDTSGGPYLMRAAALGDIDKDGFDDFSWSEATALRAEATHTSGNTLYSAAGTGRRAPMTSTFPPRQRPRNIWSCTIPRRPA